MHEARRLGKYEKEFEINMRLKAHIQTWFLIEVSHAGSCACAYIWWNTNFWDSFLYETMSS